MLSCSSTIRTGLLPVMVTTSPGIEDLSWCGDVLSYRFQRRAFPGWYAVASVIGFLARIDASWINPVVTQRMEIHDTHRPLTPIKKGIGHEWECLILCALAVMSSGYESRRVGQQGAPCLFTCAHDRQKQRDRRIVRPVEAEGSWV